MRLRTRIMLGAAGVFSYLLVKGTLELDRRYDELEECEAEFNKKVQMAKNGVDADNVIDVHFDDVD